MIVVAALPAHAQTIVTAVRTLKLAAGAQFLDAEFNSLNGVRELSDGRTLITDGRPPRIVVADWATGRLESISRVGAGPGEYQSVEGLFALAGDSSLLVDGFGKRRLVFDGRRIVQTIAAGDPTKATLGGVIGADGAGHVLASREFGAHRDAATTARLAFTGTLWRSFSAHAIAATPIRFRDCPMDARR